MKRLTALILTLSLALTLCAGMSVFAASATAPTGSERCFYANGTAVTISEVPPDNGTLVDLESFTATGTSAYISWVDNEEAMYVGVSELCNVFGGGSEGTSFDTGSVTMTGGTISHLYGGGKSVVAAERAYVTETVVNFSGGTITGTVFGGGSSFASVGSATVNISGSAHSMFASGGGAAATAPDSDELPNDFVSVNIINITDSTVLNVSGGDVDYFYGGGQGYSLVESTTITVTGGNIDYLICGGSNGKTEASTLNLQGGTVGIIQGVERGIVENHTMNILGGTVKGLKGRAIVLGNGGDSGNSGAVTESAGLNITEGATISGGVYLGRGLNGAHSSDKSGSVTPCAQINIKSPIKVEAANFNPDSTENDSLTLGSGTTLTLKNISDGAGTELEIPANGTLTNLGKIVVESKSTLSIPANATLVNGVTVSPSTSTASVASVASVASAPAATAGVVENHGNLSNAGTLTNNGLVKVLDTGRLAISGALKNDGALENGGAITNSGKFTNAGTLKNSGELTIADVGALTNDGTLENGGSIANTGTIGGSKPICATDSGSLESTGTSTLSERKVLDGVGARRTKGAARDMVIRASDSETNSSFFADADGKDLLPGSNILLDGDVSLIDQPDKCSVTKGSVMVTLKKSYLDTLADGTHTVRIVYSDGSYTQTTFSLTSPSSPGSSSNSSSVPSTASHPNPSTGFNLWAWLAGLFA